jgi:anti-anti-sigma regulatory factor
VPSTVTQGDRLRPQDLTPADQQALRDLWRVYGTDYDEIMREAENALSDDAEAAPQRSMLEERRLNYKELLGKAMLEGDWEPYLAGLREQGVGYARMGLSFGGWFRVLSVVRPLIFRRVRTAYEDEPERLYSVLRVMDQWLDSAMSMIADSYLDAKEQAIQEQQEAILELSTPVLTLTQELLLVPVVGAIDSYRARQMTDHLLQAIHRHRVKVVIIDVTGVPAVDTTVANHLLQAMDAAGLLGATAIITGLSADMAQTVVRLGVDLTRLRTVGDLQGGVTEAMRLIGFKLVRVDEGH